jgi:hypothetical protein
MKSIIKNSALGVGASMLLVSSAFAASNSNKGNSNGSTQSAFVLCRAGNSVIARASKCRRGETKLTVINFAEQLNLESEAPLISGEVVTGVIGATVAGTTGTVLPFSVTSSFPEETSQDLTDADVIVAATTQTATECGVSSACYTAEEKSAAANCTGTITAPTAPAGKVCIYPTSILNAQEIKGVAVAAVGASTGASQGFALDWQHPGTGSNTTGIEAVWAYTAP